MTQTDDTPAGFVPRGKYERDIAQLRKRLATLEQRLNDAPASSEVDTQYGKQFEEPVVATLEPGQTGTLTELIEVFKAETQLVYNDKAKEHARDLLRGYDTFEMLGPGRWRYDP